eukprot:359060-Chlamydomonas_euryale.AAC.12
MHTWKGNEGGARAFQRQSMPEACQSSGAREANKIAGVGGEGTQQLALQGNPALPHRQTGTPTVGREHNSWHCRATQPFPTGMQTKPQ